MSTKRPRRRNVHYREPEVLEMERTAKGFDVAFVDGEKNIKVTVSCCWWTLNWLAREMWMVIREEEEAMTQRIDQAKRKMRGE